MEDSRCRRATRALVLAIAYFATGVCLCLPGPTLVELSGQTHSNYSRLSYMFAARSSGELFGSLMGDRLAGGAPVRLLSGSLSLCAAGLVAVPWCTDLALLILAAAAQGVALGAAATASAKLCDQWALGGVRLLGLVGASVCPVLAVVAGEMRVAYWASAALLATASLLCAPWSSKPPAERRHEPPQSARQPTCYVTGALGLAALFLSCGSHRALGQLISAFSAVFSDGGALASGLAACFFYGSNLATGAAAQLLGTRRGWLLGASQAAAVGGAALLTWLPRPWAMPWLAAALLGCTLQACSGTGTTLRTTAQRVGEMLACLVLGSALDCDDATAFGVRALVLTALALAASLALWYATQRYSRRDADHDGVVQRNVSSTRWYVQRAEPSINRETPVAEDARSQDSQSSSARGAAG